MKHRFKILLTVLMMMSAAVIAGTNGTPLLRPFLQTDLNGNGQSATNFNSLVTTNETVKGLLTTSNLNATNINAGSITATNFGGNGISLTNLNPTNLSSTVPTNKLPGFSAAWSTNDPSTFSSGAVDYSPFGVAILTSPTGFGFSPDYAYVLTNSVGTGQAVFSPGGEAVFTGDLSAFTLGSRSGGYAERWGGIVSNNRYHQYSVLSNTSVIFLDEKHTSVVLPPANTGAFPNIGALNRLDVRGDIGINTGIISCDGAIYADVDLDHSFTTTVTGDGSGSFTTQVQVGDTIVEDDYSQATVTDVIDDNTLTTDVPLTCDSDSPQSFGIVRRSLRISANGTVTVYSGEVMALHGLPSIVFNNSSTARTNATGFLYTPTVDGFYRFTAVANVTRAATTSSTLGPVYITYTDKRDSALKFQTNNVTSTINATNQSISASLIGYCKANSPTTVNVLSTTVGTTNMQFNADFIIEKF